MEKEREGNATRPRHEGERPEFPCKAPDHPVGVHGTASARDVECRPPIIGPLECRLVQFDASIEGERTRDYIIGAYHGRDLVTGVRHRDGE